MAVFEYTALDSKGKKVRGVVDADSEKAARSKLKKDGFFPTGISESRVKASKSGNPDRSRQLMQQRVSTGELGIATRQLSTLVGAGVPLVEALAALSEQLEHKYLKRVFSETCELVKEGTTFAKALGTYPKVFPRLFVKMVSSGEASGSLDLILDRLADMLEAQSDLQRKVGAALAYPIFLVILCLVAVGILMTYVVPQISEIFEGQGRVLPTPTLIVISISNAIRSYWYLGIGSTVLIGYFFNRYKESKKGRLQIDKLKLSLPMLGPLNLKVATTRMSRALATLLSGGVDLLNALDISKSILGNVVLEKAVSDAADGVREGKGLAAELKKSDKFPVLLTHLISIGEKTGELEKMLGRVAQSYESQTDAFLAAFTRTLGPLLILFLAVIVLGILLSVMLPMLEMSNIAPV